MWKGATTFAFYLCFLAYFLCVSDLLSPSTGLAILNDDPGAVDLCSYQPRIPGNLEQDLVDGTLDEEDIKQIRYEMIRQQILQKLHLDRPPCHPQADRRALEPIRNAIELHERPTEDVESLEVEQTESEESVVIFPNNTVFECQHQNERPCSRLEFWLPTSTESVLSADLWLFKESSSPLEMLTVIQLGRRPRVLTVEGEDEDHSGDNNTDSWIKFKLPQGVTLHKVETHPVLTLEVYGAAIATSSGEHRPFLVATALSRSAPRARRTTPTTGCNNDGKCCREDLYVSFVEMGFGDWILHPHGYNAHYCRGQCLEDFSSSPNHFASLLFTYTKLNSTAAERLGFRLCCTPAKLSPLTILWNDTRGIIHHQAMSNMIVDSCECA